jgi:hypothetical protein
MTSGLRPPKDERCNTGWASEDLKIIREMGRQAERSWVCREGVVKALDANLP